MAAVYPKVQPVDFYKDETLKGERLVQDALATLPDAYHVYFNPRLNPREIQDPYDRAIDFIVLHPEKGILAIDVKGGEIVEEPNGYLSQYQPARKLYKIIDPVKQANTALGHLLDMCDDRFRESIPSGIAVFFPDTSQVEFAQSKSVHFFREDLESNQLRQRLEMIFPEPYEKKTTAKLIADLAKLAEFLKVHSDNYNPVKEQVKRLQGDAAKKQAYQLPEGMARSNVTKLRNGAPKREETETWREIPQLREKDSVAPAQKQAAEKPPKMEKVLEPELVPPPMARESYVAPHTSRQGGATQQRFAELESNIVIEPHYWIAAVVIASVVIAVTYFLFHNIAVLLATR